MNNDIWQFFPSYIEEFSTSQNIENLISYNFQTSLETLLKFADKKIIKFVHQAKNILAPWLSKLLKMFDPKQTHCAAFQKLIKIDARR